MASNTHVLRIMNDVREFYKEKPTGIFIFPEEDDICFIHALIIGPENTPYANGFFYFDLKFPTDYPLNPPAVNFKTTSRKTVRFNPNLYACGRVCLSILGTWTGPSWSSAQTIFTTLLSIQSLMTEHPYHNEPGYENRKNVRENVSDYDALITHETLRVAVIGMLQDDSMDTFGMPPALKEIMISHFNLNYDFYKNLIESNQNNDGMPIRDPFNDPYRPKTFQYKDLFNKIVELKEKFGSVKDTSNSNYNNMAKQMLSSSARDEEKPGDDSSDSTEDVEDFHESTEELNGANLYESESDGENENENEI